jgi:prefoldin subunit 5
MCYTVSICSPDKLIDLIGSNLYNFMMASAEGSKAIMEKENELKKCADESKRLQETIERLRQRVEALERMLRAAKYTFLAHGLHEKYGMMFLVRKFLDNI